MEDATLAGCKKNAQRLGAYLIFVDESGFLLLPLIAKTWSLRGKTPIVRHWTWPRDKVSVISGVTISPVHHRLNLRYAVHGNTNIAGPQVEAFLMKVLRAIRGPIVLLWDGSKTHQTQRIRQICSRHPRLILERFPPYAPELNPDEAVWSLAKRDLANSRSDDRDQLEHRVRAALDRTRHSAARLRGCLHATGLKFF